MIFMIFFHSGPFTYSFYIHFIFTLYSLYTHYIFILYSSYIQFICILYSFYMHFIFILYLFYSLLRPIYAATSGDFPKLGNFQIAGRSRPCVHRLKGGKTQNLWGRSSPIYYNLCTYVIYIYIYYTYIHIKVNPIPNS